ncbi:MAG: hypothetical protein WCX69_01540 [Candidatus Paceibacterota bacterium]
MNAAVTAISALIVLSLALMTQGAAQNEEIGMQALAQFFAYGLNDSAPASVVIISNETTAIISAQGIHAELAGNEGNISEIRIIFRGENNSLEVEVRGIFIPNFPIKRATLAGEIITKSLTLSIHHLKLSSDGRRVLFSSDYSSERGDF